MKDNNNVVDIFSELEKPMQDFSKEKGSQLSQLIEELNQTEKAVKDAEQTLKLEKLKKHKLSTEKIPRLMEEMGVTGWETNDHSVKLKPLINANISADNKEKAFNWLREHGCESIIKNDVTISFGASEDNFARNLKGELEEKGFTPILKTHVHPSTLKAFVKERKENGEPIDDNLFGVYATQTTDIKRK